MYYGETPPGTLKDCLKQNERIELRATTVKQKLIGKRHIETVLTSAKRTFFLNSHCNEKADDDLVVGKGAKIERQKKNVLIVLDTNDRNWKLVFHYESDCDEFARAYKALASTIRNT